MTPIVRSSLVAVVGCLSIGWFAGAVYSQQAAACLHGAGETAADEGRRQQALRAVRQINTAQAQSFVRTKAYLTFRDVTASAEVARPPEFVTQLTVEGSTYAVSLRDASDPCRYTLFSDQEGVIYVGSPLQ